MAVFTSVSASQVQALLNHLQLGQLQNLQGIEGGIENTNYFVDAKHTDAAEPTHWVLTLFERLDATQLPFYLQLMRHLAERGIPVPAPAANAKAQLLFEIAGKPCALVRKLPGRSVLAPQATHCAAVGAMLARMHWAGRDFEMQQANLRGLAWWNETAPLLQAHLNAEQWHLLGQELAYQNHIDSSAAAKALPRGPIHADLFRDNVLFVEQAPGAAPVLGGLFDFYFAGCDSWLFDLAVCLNDWCIDWTTGAGDAARERAFLEAYQSVRPLQSAERQLLPAMLRAAALRFWISRLWDFYLPRSAQLLKPHDPTHFERVLRQRCEN